MKPTSGPDLEAQVCQKVLGMFIPGDLPYLRNLSRTNFVHVLIQALSLLRLYPHNDAAARAAMSALVEKHTDHWRAWLSQGSTTGVQ